MTALSIIVSIILILVSIVLIVAVLMQQGQRQGLGAIGGGAETFLGKNKAKSIEGKLAKITKIAAVVFIVLAIASTIVTSHNPDNVSTNEAIQQLTEALNNAQLEAETTEDAATETADTAATEDAATEAADTAATEDAAAEAADAVVTEDAATDTAETPAA